MNAGRQLPLVSDALEIRGKLLTFLFRQGLADHLLVLFRYLPDLLEKLLPSRGEMYSIESTVFCVPPAFDQSASLQFVEQVDNTARMHFQLRGHLLLAHARRPAKHMEDSGVRR